MCVSSASGGQGHDVRLAGWGCWEVSQELRSPTMRTGTGSVTMRRNRAVGEWWPRSEWGCRLAAVAVTYLAAGTAMAQTPTFWRSDLSWHIARYIQYPDARKPCPHREGTVLVKFSINRDGRVLDARVARSSGVKVLDSEALQAVKRASPFPLPPTLVSPLRMTFDQPVIFSSPRCRGIGPQPARPKREQP